MSIDSKIYNLALLVIVGCSVAVTWKYFHWEDGRSEVPTKEEILKALENGVSNLTVVPAGGEN